MRTTNWSLTVIVKIRRRHRNGWPSLSPDQTAQVSGLAAQYIATQRERYNPRAVPLSAQQRPAMNGFFSPQFLPSKTTAVCRKVLAIALLFLASVAHSDDSDRFPPEPSATLQPISRAQIA